MGNRASSCSAAGCEFRPCPEDAICSDGPPLPVPVYLNVYDLGTGYGTKHINRLLRTLGTGLFHCGIEIHGTEWSFRGGDSDVCGIISCLPQMCPEHRFSESMSLGEVGVDEDELRAMVKELQQDWPMSSYDNLRRNCTHFSECLSQRLGLGPLPSWVKSAAEVGAALEDQVVSLTSDDSGKQRAQKSAKAEVRAS